MVRLRLGSAFLDALDPQEGHARIRAAVRFFLLRNLPEDGREEFFKSWLWFMSAALGNVGIM